MHYLNPYRSIEPAHKIEYQRTILLENIRSLKIIAIIGSTLNLFILLSGAVNGGSDTLTNANTILRMVWILFSAIYYLAVGNPQTPADIRFRHQVLFYSAAFISLACSSMITGNLSFEQGSTYLYIINCMLTFTMMQFSLPQALAISLPQLGYLFFRLYTYEESILAINLNIWNILAVTIFSNLVTATAFYSRLKLLDFQRTILKQNQSLKDQVQLDGLTKISNRRKFDTVYAHELAHAQRTGSPLSVISLDVDNFKNFNDTYGHLAGDDCLIHLAGLLKRSLSRKTDEAFRIGGEEFILLLPYTDPEGALHLARKIQDALAANPIPHTGSPYGRITLSVGIANSQKLGSNTAASLLLAADQALYTSKKSGRNRITVFDPSLQIENGDQLSQ